MWLLNYFIRKSLMFKGADLRYSPMKFTQSTAQRRQAYSPSRKNDHKLSLNKYFCHYSNSLYMGGMESFKRSGQGLILLDDGSCVLCHHSHDNLIGHNVIFRSKSLTSIIIDTVRNRSVCFRTNQFLLHILINPNDQIQGAGCLIDYKMKKIFKLIFKHSKLSKKVRLMDKLLLEQVFNKKDTTDLIHLTHARALDFDFRDFDLKSDLKYVANGDEHLIGFSSKKGQAKSRPQGLTFRMRVVQEADKFNITIEERGYYDLEHMQNFGERYFQNGNMYIGAFDKGQFHGQGILFDRAAKKWTHGKYYKNQLIEVIDSSVQNKKESLSDIIRKLHKNDRSYIDFKVIIKPSEHTLKQVLNCVNEFDPYERERLDIAGEEQKRQMRLKTIHEDYTHKHYEHRTQQAIVAQLKGQNPVGQNPASRTATQTKEKKGQRVSYIHEPDKDEKKPSYLTNRNKTHRDTSSKKGRIGTDSKESPETSSTPQKYQNKWRNRSKSPGEKTVNELISSFYHNPEVQIPPKNDSTPVKQLLEQPYILQKALDVQYQQQRRLLNLERNLLETTLRKRLEELDLRSNHTLPHHLTPQHLYPRLGQRYQDRDHSRSGEKSRPREYRYLAERPEEQQQLIHRLYESRYLHDRY